MTNGGVDHACWIYREFTSQELLYFFYTLLIICGVFNLFVGVFNLWKQNIYIKKISLLIHTLTK